MSETDSHTHRADEGASGHATSAAGQSQRRLLIVLGLTLVYVLAEVAGGLYTHSLALLANAGHMFTDAFGLGLAVAAINFARRSATPQKTYGFYRTEILAALANAILLILVSVYILFEAWQRLRQPPEVDALPMLIVAIGGLAVTLVGVKLLHAGSEESLNVRGAFLEVLSDLFGALGTIVAALVLLFTGWPWADVIASLFIGVLVLPRAWGLLKSVVEVLLEAAPAGMRVEEIQAALCQVPGVRSVHDLHLWTITSGFVAMSGHVEAVGRPSEDVLHDLQRLVRERFKIEHATLQVESADHADDGACCTADPRCLVVGASSWRVPAQRRRE
jgi:cobalt-zinc-cadmium efflux system protein